MVLQVESDGAALREQWEVEQRRGFECQLESGDPGVGGQDPGMARVVFKCHSPNLYCVPCTLP